MALLIRVLALSLLCHGVIAGPSGPAAAQALTERSAPRKLHGRFLHITDIHPDQFYKVHSSTDQDGACHRGKGPAGTYGAETTDCDTPFALVNATFDWIAANLRDKIDFVVWTGDSARHDRDERIPRTPDQVLGTNAWIADRFAQLFADSDGRGMTVPVVPSFGNNDILPHNILMPGPNKWLQYYTHIWRHFIPEEQKHTFELGGWFHVEVIPNKLAVFSLNTLYFFDRNAGVDGCANPSEPGYKQLEWLRVQLQLLRERGMKAILMGHVPPARTQSKRLWDETCWQKYSLWTHQFRDVVVVGLYGHMNIDHFLIHDKDDIDMAAMSGSSEVGTREAMEDELSVQSASDYLVELREHWSKLPPPPTLASKREEINKGGRRERGKKRKDRWAERYHLSLIGPSIVPNYFPTLRVFEYNITGLENAAVWKDTSKKALAQDTADVSQKPLDLRHLSTIESDAEAEAETDIDINKSKKKKKRKNKPKKPQHDPNLIIPSPPSKTAPPGPAYSPQPLTLTGFTQYFANLTYINNLNLTSADEDDTETSSLPFFSWLRDGGGDDDGDDWWWWLRRWRKGKHSGKKPAGARPPRPREFAFEVEYSTFEDRIYRLDDLTVNSFVELAVRIGGVVGSSGEEEGGREVDAGMGLDDEGEGDEGVEVEVDEFEEGEDGSEKGGSDDDEEEEVGVEKKKKKKKGRKGKDRRRKRKGNKTWLHFLRHAFVCTLEKDELKKFS
ncbi:hypothetical protein VTK56DRAFT_8073 [Thermocarpiscus australiensis]